MIRPFYLILSLLIVSHASHAQDDSANNHFKKGLEFIDKKLPDSAIFYFEKAYPLYQQSRNWEKVARIHYKLGESYNKKREFEKSLGYFYKGLEIGKKHLEENHLLLSDIEIYIGVVHTKIGEFKEAEAAFLRSLSLLEKNNSENKDLAYVYKRLGLLSMYKADYEEALKWYNQSLNIYQKIKYEDMVINVLIELGTVYYYQSKWMKSIEMYEKAIAHPQISLQSKGVVLNNIVGIYTDNKQYAKASKAAKECVQIFETLRPDFEDRLVGAIQTLAHLYYLQNNFPLALQHYQKALNLAKQENVYGKKHREIAKIYKEMGDVYLEKRHIPEALQYYQKTLIALLPNFNDSNIQVYPSTSELFAEPWIMVALNAKAYAFYQQYQKSHQVDDLKKAFEGYLLAVENLNIITQGFDSQESQEAIRNKEYDLFGSAIQIAYELHQLYPSNKTYLQQAFTLAEKSKAFSLLQKLKNIEDQQLAELPDSLIEQSQTLQQNIASLEAQLKIDSTSTTLPDSLFQLQKEHTQFNNYLKNTYPHYRKIKYQDKSISLEVLQKSLSQQSSSQNNKALLQFFTGDSTLYAFLITPTSAQLKPIPFTPQLQKQILDLQKSIYQRDSLTADFQFDQYTHNAQKLYQKLLLEPFGSDVLQNIQHIFIVPDGLLYRIPFEALLTQAPTSTQSQNLSYQNLAYLLKSHNISYAYSATLLMESLQNRSQNSSTYKGDLLGFAPSFGQSYQLLSSKIAEDEIMRDCKGGNLKSLPFSELEVRTISKIIEGQVFIETGANKLAFLEEAQHYRILHLSTHACMDEEDHESSRIYFADQPLLSKELYPLQLQADLAVLSACETGTGPIQQGEGVMSLARAFMYAGCPSVVTSLWSVSDEKTSEVMEGFYQNLKDGASKSAALRNAKLSFLQHQNNENAHPFYWAAFIQIGNPNPVILQDNSWKFWGSILLTLGLIALIVFSFSRRK